MLKIVRSSVFVLSLMIVLSGCTEEAFNPDPSIVQASVWVKLDSVKKAEVVQRELSTLTYDGPITAQQISDSLSLQYSLIPPASFSMEVAIENELGNLRFKQLLGQITNQDPEDQVKRLEILLNTQPGFSDIVKKDVLQKINNLKSDTEHAKGTPLAVDKAYVIKNSIGTHEAHVIVRNTSDKVVDAFKVHIKCFNSFDEPVESAGSGNVYNGISQEREIAPGQTSGDRYHWALVMQDTTTKITAEVYEVHFTDSSTWK